MIDKFRKIAAGNRIREVIILIMGVGWISSMLWKDWLNKQETLVCVLGGGTSFIGYADPLSEAKEYHVFLAKEAMEAIFSRNPDGYSKWELATRILNTATQNSLLKDKPKDDLNFRKYSITQTFQDTHISEIPIDANALTMMIRGNINRNLIREGQPTSESVPVRVMIRLQRDDHWEIKGRFAMTVSQLQVDSVL